MLKIKIPNERNFHKTCDLISRDMTDCCRTNEWSFKITRGSYSTPYYNGLKCNISTSFCNLCCRRQEHKSRTCVNGGNYYFCKCQD